MSYYLIDNLPVFLSWARYYSLREEIVEGLDIGDDRFFGLRGWDSKEAWELSKIIINLLGEKKKLDEGSFLSEWVAFDMGTNESADNACELLYDYCRYTGNAVFKSLDGRLKSRFEACSPDSYSIGRYFALEIPASGISLLNRVLGKKRCTTRIMIDSEKISSIKGTLDDFTVTYRDMPIRFYSSIEVFSPPAAATS